MKRSPGSWARGEGGEGDHGERNEGGERHQEPAHGLIMAVGGVAGGDGAP